MTKKYVVVLIISILALALAAISLLTTIKFSGETKEEKANAEDVDESSDSEDIQYVLYLGTNDKDTNEPVFSEEEAQEKLREILINQFGGYTIQEAHGGWKEDDKVYQEYTLVIYLSDTSIDDVHKACDEMIDVFHQSSVLIQCNKTTTEFYSAE